MTDDHLDASKRHEIVTLLREMIRNACVNDGTPESGHEERNADTLAAYLGNDLALRRYSAAPGRDSLIARIEGCDPRAPSLCLLGHLDVVPALADDWVRDPFGGEFVDGEIWGRGAIDMLNMTAGMAVAMKQLAAEGFRPAGDVVFAAVADEEARAEYGTRFLLAHHRDDVVTDYVLTEGGGYPLSTHQPIKLSWASAEKGITWLRLIVRGTAGHASNPHGADNALLTAGAILHRLAEQAPAPVVSDLWRDWTDAMGIPSSTAQALLRPETPQHVDTALAATAHASTHMTVSPTRIQGGVATNSIPEQVTIDIDVRTLPGQGRTDIETYLNELLGHLMNKVSIEWTYEAPPSSSPSDGAFRDIVERVTRRIQPAATLVPSLLTASTDATYFRDAGARAYGFMVPSERYSGAELAAMFHGANERIDVTSLTMTTRLWIDVIKELATP